MSEQATNAGPRTRWGAIVWGAAFASVAGWGLWVVTDAHRRAHIADTIVQTTPFTAVMWVVLAIGGLILVGGLVALIRRAQRARSAGEITGNIEKPEDAQSLDVGIPD